MLIAVENKFQRQRNLRLCIENSFVYGLPSGVFDNFFVTKNKYRCQRRPIVSRVVQKVPPITGNVLVLGFNFAISPRSVCRSRSQSDAQFFCLVNEVGIIGSSSSVVYKKLRNSKKMFFNGRDSNLSFSNRNWVNHQETRKFINNQKAMEIPVTWWVKWSPVIDMDCLEWNSLVLPFFQWYFICMFRFWFVGLASQTISSVCTYPVKHAKTVVESVCITVGF